nr:hypothetical protein [Tanacetum cinerariifolium]
MPYGAVPDALDKYLQMGATTACKSLQMFCKAIMELYGEEFLRKPIYTEIKKLYAHHNEKHEFSGMSRPSAIVTSLKDDLFFFARGVLESANVIMEALGIPVTLVEMGWSRSDKVKSSHG